MKLPDGIAVVLIYQDRYSFRKTCKMTNYESILNGYRMLNSSGRQALIYPVDNEKKVHLTDTTIVLALREAMTLDEFKEYLYD